MVVRNTMTKILVWWIIKVFAQYLAKLDNQEKLLRVYKINQQGFKLVGYREEKALVQLICSFMSHMAW